MDNVDKAKFFLRFGIAVVFLYAAVASFINPASWIGFIPQFIKNVISGSVFLAIYSAYEICLAFWLFSGKKTFYASIVAGATLLLIVILNISQFDIVFRDVAILFACVALAFLTKEK
ncbi:MAG: hypothetical protein AABY22_00335 [Nanoarchaeota archaeon]